MTAGLPSFILLCGHSPGVTPRVPREVLVLEAGCSSSSHRGGGAHSRPSPPFLGCSLWAGRQPPSQLLTTTHRPLGPQRRREGSPPSAHSRPRALLPCPMPGALGHSDSSGADGCWCGWRRPGVALEDRAAPGRRPGSGCRWWKGARAAVRGGRACLLLHPTRWVFSAKKWLTTCVL